MRDLLKGEVGNMKNERVTCVQWMLLKRSGSVLSSVPTPPTSLIFFTQWIPYSPARSTCQAQGDCLTASATAPTGFSTESIKCC